MKTEQKIAFVFPGQGSQSLGMMNAWVDSYPLVKETFEEASDTLSVPLWQLVTDGPEAELNQTRNTQPVMLTAGIAIWRCWQQAGGPQPAMLAGHSLGEYTALVASDVLTFSEGLKLAAFRAKAMQEAVPNGQGAMAAVLGMEEADLSALCTQCAQGEVLAPVNFNAPGQIVVAGTAEAVGRLRDAATAAGAKKVVLLPVSVPSHCALMQPAADALAEYLAQLSLRTPKIPIVHNVTAKPASTEEERINLLVKQVSMPVQWVNTILTIKEHGIETVIECGPGKVLTGLNKRIDKSLTLGSLQDPASLDALLKTC